MANGHSRGPWKAEWSKSRGIPVLFIRNGRRDPIAMIYSSEADAELMAAAPRLLSCLKCAAKAFAHDGDQTESQARALAKADALIAELAP